MLKNKQKFTKFTLSNKKIQFITSLLTEEKYDNVIKVLKGSSLFYHVDEDMVIHLVSITSRHSSEYRYRLVRYIMESL